MDILSDIRGLSYQLPELYSMVSQNGWEIKKVKFESKKDRFEATAKNPHGEELTGWGKTDKLAVANLVMHVMHRNQSRIGKLAMWKTQFTTDLAAIAEAYSKAPLYEPKAAIAFMELGRDSEHRAKTLMGHLEITMTNNPEPYPSPEKMFDDIRKRRKLEVSRAGLEHPLWTPNQVISYRIVHDVLGHCASGGGFDWEGENQAFAAHAAIVPHTAQQALFTESIASTAYATYYRAYGPLKVALFPEFIEEAQSKENKSPGHRGIHPSLSQPPLPKPRVKPLAHAGGADCGYDSELPQKFAAGLTDPNAGWQSGVAPLPQNAMLDYGDPLGAMPPIQMGGAAPVQDGPLFENARLIDTEWAQLNQEDPKDIAQMKLAITNAFRVVLLSPRKNLRWNAIHYQDISHLPPEESDPTKYWHTLEQSRQNWNVQRHGEDMRYQHMPYYKQWKDLEQLMYQKDPQSGWPAAQKAAEDFLFRMRTRIEEQVMSEDADIAEDKQRNMYAIENEANKRVSTALKMYIKEHQMGFDFESAVAPEQMGFDMPEVEQVPTPDKAKYGAWMGTHLKAISQISRHVDEILKAALFDVHNHDGSGHHFRSVVLSLQIPGVGPKVCSFAWLLLQPMTSQLGTMDVHMMAFLGHNYEKDMNPRDYFKFERQLQAGRDAAGYGHVPLGLFQWGTWDLARTGPGTHQDHSAMRVLDPKPHSMIDWQDSHASGTETPTPQWWADTEEARNAVGEDWDKNVAGSVPATAIPFNQGAPLATYSKRSMQWDDQGNIQPIYQRKPGEVPYPLPSPWFTHPATGERIIGQPGMTIMQHLQQSGIPLDQAWQMEDHQVGKA